MRGGEKVLDGCSVGAKACMEEYALPPALLLAFPTHLPESMVAEPSFAGFDNVLEDGCFASASWAMAAGTDKTHGLLFKQVGSMPTDCRVPSFRRCTAEDMSSDNGVSGISSRFLAYTTAKQLRSPRVGDVMIAFAADLPDGEEVSLVAEEKWPRGRNIGTKNSDKKNDEAETDSLIRASEEGKACAKVYTIHHTLCTNVIYPCR
jgi:hypothetical protein